MINCGEPPGPGPGPGGSGVSQSTDSSTPPSVRSVRLTGPPPGDTLFLCHPKRPRRVARPHRRCRAVGSTSVVGLQWGDEAKGKIVDLLCDQHDAVVRYQGGANAGHTVVVEGVTYKLSLLPTGILRPGIDCVIGNGVVIHPPALLKEIDALAKQGVAIGPRLYVSDRAHVILPHHLAEERLTEESDSAADHLGTTRRGIGPCYRDKVGRAHGVRVGDLYHPDLFRERLDRIIAYKNRLLMAVLPDFEPFDPRAVADEYLGLAERLRPFVRDTTTWLHQAVATGRRLLFEGAQGSLLDVDHGSYPYVTSSNSSAAGIAAGSGVPTRYIDRWIGIVKSYMTRVGVGPFPTEQDNAIGERIRRVGKEYRTVTGRRRRCGWFDAVADEGGPGRAVAAMPGPVADLERCRPVYATLPGWSEDLTAQRDWSELPARARGYVRFLAEQIGVPVAIVSVGPERRQTIAVPTAD